MLLAFWRLRLFTDSSWNRAKPMLWLTLGHAWRSWAAASLLRQRVLLKHQNPSPIYHLLINWSPSRKRLHRNWLSSSRKWRALSTWGTAQHQWPASLFAQECTLPRCYAAQIHPPSTYDIKLYTHNQMDQGPKRRDNGKPFHSASIGHTYSYPSRKLLNTVLNPLIVSWNLFGWVSTCTLAKVWLLSSRRLVLSYLWWIQIVGRFVNELKDKAEPYRKMVMEMITNGLKFSWSMVSSIPSRNKPPRIRSCLTVPELLSMHLVSILNHISPKLFPPSSGTWTLRAPRSVSKLPIWPLIWQSSSSNVAKISSSKLGLVLFEQRSTLTPWEASLQLSVLLPMLLVWRKWTHQSKIYVSFHLL